MISVNFKIQSSYGKWFKHKLTSNLSDASPSNKEHVLNDIKFNERGLIHTNPSDIWKP
jgi:hypothetical protein